MQAEQIPILRLHDMFLGGVPERSAEVDKVGGVSDRG
jgi:hypothetical protein